MACIGGDKWTKDRIRANNIFSANLVTEELLPIADYFGNIEGYNRDKANVTVEVEKGHVLDVPVISKSPWVYELEVKQSIAHNGGDVFLCKVRNVLADELLCDETTSVEQRIKVIKPVHTTYETYFGWNGNKIGSWSEPMKKI